MGLHTAAGAVAAGARGVVLDAQLALTRECDLDDRTRRAVRAMDGSETRVVGGHRIYTRPALPAAALDAGTPAATVAARLGEDVHRDLVPIGQDGAVASGLADRHVTVGGVVAAVCRQVHQIEAARLAAPLAPGHGVARTHGTRVPVAQGLVLWEAAVDALDVLFAGGIHDARSAAAVSALAAPLVERGAASAC